MRNKRLTVYIGPELLYKVKYIAKYEKRHASTQVLLWIKRYVEGFERMNGEIIQKMDECDVT